MASKKPVSKSKKAAAKKPAGKSSAGKSVKKAAPKKAAPKKAAPKKAAKKAPAKKPVVKKTVKTKATVKKAGVSAKSTKKAVPAKKSAVKAVKKPAPQKSTHAPKKTEVKKATMPASVKVIKAEPKKVVKSVVPAPKTIQTPVQKATTLKKATVQMPVVPSVKIESKPMIEKKAETEVKKVVTTQRYSDSDLAEFKTLVVRKLEEARQELVNLQAQIINANENGTDDTGASFKMLEDGSETLAKEEAANLAARQKKFIEQLEAALIRIENKTYGICRVTGQLIPKERLRAVPHTTQSMEAKLKQYKD